MLLPLGAAAICCQPLSQGSTQPLHCLLALTSLTNYCLGLGCRCLGFGSWFWSWICRIFMQDVTKCCLSPQLVFSESAQYNESMCSCEFYSSLNRGLAVNKRFIQIVLNVVTMAFLLYNALLIQSLDAVICFWLSNASCKVLQFDSL